MTADEIRNSKWGADVAADQAGIAFLLAEIAAQLAELNQNLRDIHPELNLPEECRQHTCDYYTGYLSYGERSEDMSHEAYHSEAKRFEAHMKTCSQSESTTVCKTCMRYEKRLRA